MLFLSITLILLLLPLLLLAPFSYHSVIKFIIVKLTQNFDHLSLPKCDLVGKFQLYFIANSLNNVIITIHIIIEI